MNCEAPLLTGVMNPFWLRSDNHRDPFVLKTQDGYYLFYSRHVGPEWGGEERWAIARAFTRDFRNFSDDRDISPKGFASPGDVVQWHGRLVLPYQSYPLPPHRLCYALSGDAGRTWSDPVYFLDEARQLAWNLDRRLIDPAFVVDGDTLHCYFVGSSGWGGGGTRANLLGHATTRDPQLRDWTIHSMQQPLMGMSEFAPDGVENVVVFRPGNEWIMLLSEGLNEQHLAYATSPDLCRWTRGGRIDLPVQYWMRHRYGAPCVWREQDIWYMVLMGEETPQHRAFLGLLASRDGLNWMLAPERSRT